MVTIWKFPLEITATQKILIPEVRRWLSVQVQNGVPCIWALVADGGEREEVTIRIHGTGDVSNDVAGMKHLGTVQSGLAVWHVFVYELDNAPGIL